MKTNREETDRRDFVVCIAEKPWKPTRGNGFPLFMPVKGEIYSIKDSTTYNNLTYYILNECPGGGYESRQFRPVDHDSGNALSEWIEDVLLKQAELETAMG